MPQDPPRSRLLHRLQGINFYKLVVLSALAFILLSAARCCATIPTRMRQMEGRLQAQAEADLNAWYDEYSTVETALENAWATLDHVDSDNAWATVSAAEGRIESLEDISPLRQNTPTPKLDTLLDRAQATLEARQELLYHEVSATLMIRQIQLQPTAWLQTTLVAQVQETYEARSDALVVEAQATYNAQARATETAQGDGYTPWLRLLRRIKRR